MDITVDDVKEKSENKMGAAEKIQYLDEPIKLETNAPKRVNVVLSPEASKRLSSIVDQVNPHTQSEAISKSLHLLETFLAARENKTKVYLQNEGSDELVEFRLCLE